MRKGFLIMLAVVLVAALAAPAMAGTDINGLYRAKAWVSNFRTTASYPGLQKDAVSSAFVEQRLRLKFSIGDENVKVVFFTENDLTAWGDAAGGTPVSITDNTSGTAATTGVYTGGAARNSGGALGADRINTEIKNTYVWFKVPNTSLDFTVGLQNQTDAYAGLLFGAADFGGVFVNGKYDPVAYTLGWAKLYENASNKADDLTLYLASAKFSPTKDVKLGLNFYVLQDDTGKVASTLPVSGNSWVVNFPYSESYDALWADLRSLNGTGLNSKKVYIPGVDFTFNAGPATLSGFAMYQFGKVDYQSASTPDIDIKGFAIDLRGDMNVGPGKAFLEGLYISGGDNNAKEIKSIVTFSDFDASPGGNSAFGRTDMSILLVNADDINCAQALVGARSVPSSGSTSPALGGRGMLHFAGGYTQKLGDKLTGKIGAGYLAASKLMLSDTNKKGKALGTEVNANVNYNILKGLDFGVYGAYGWLGDYFKFKTQGSTLASQDPDNIWSANMRLNYAF